MKAEDGPSLQQRQGSTTYTLHTYQGKLGNEGQGHIQGYDTSQTAGMAEVGSDRLTRRVTSEQPRVKEEDNERHMDTEGMAEGDGERVGESDQKPTQQTAAERMAAKRKLRRFRCVIPESYGPLRPAAAKPANHERQSDPSANPLHGERVCEAATPRRSEPRATVPTDNRSQLTTGASMVPEPVRVSSPCMLMLFLD